MSIVLQVSTLFHKMTVNWNLSVVTRFSLKTEVMQTGGKEVLTTGRAGFLPIM